jgi:hypothetical protein
MKSIDRNVNEKLIHLIHVLNWRNFIKSSQWLPHKRGSSGTVFLTNILLLRDLMDSENFLFYLEHKKER